MFDKLKAKIFPCEQLMKRAQENAEFATLDNAHAHANFRRVFLNSICPDFCNTKQDAKNIANPH